MAPADDSSKTRIAGGDIGQGAHKPSEKHALDDVLKSLQDLIRNELLTDPRPPAPSAPPADPSIPRKRGRPRKPPPPEPLAREVPPAPLEPAAEVEAVMNSLEHLVEHELNPEESAPAHDSAAVEETPVLRVEPVKPRADQHEFRFDADDSASPPLEETGSGMEEPPAMPDSALTVEPEPVTQDLPAAQATEEITLASDEPRLPELSPQPPVTDYPAISELEEEFTLATPPADEPADTSVPPEMPMEGAFIEEQPAESDRAETFSHELAFDDIPVLQDVVAPQPAAGAANAPTIDPQKLRDLSIRAMARLNIELRKRGESPLDAKLIDRLQSLLREELEKSTKGSK